jgi:UDP-2-acetamido-2-deoxy-ribo-hexuluronate aminotransferase
MKAPIPFLDLGRLPKQVKNLLNSTFKTFVDKGVFSGGDAVINLQHSLQAYLRHPHIVTCANGTDALEIALRALDIQPEDEVIVPAITWVSTAEAVKMVGAKVKLIDVDPDGLIDLAQLEDCINVNTKAIIPVHLYGKMVKMDKLISISQKKGIKIIEDAAQAFGATYGDKAAGTWGDIGCYSFYPSKNLGALGEAGAIGTSDPKLAEKLQRLINHGQLVRDEHLLVGRNSRIDTIQAGFLNVLLSFFDDWQVKRKLLAQIYLEELSGIEDLILPEGVLEKSHNLHLFVIQTPFRDQLKAALANSGIGTAIHYPHSLAEIPPFQEGKVFPMAKKMTKNVLSLPLNPFLKKQEVFHVCKAIKLFFKQKTLI